MADASTPRRPGPADRLRSLARAYRAIDGRYAELEGLSAQEHRLLEGGAAMAEVHAILQRKREVLVRIRAEEDEVSEDRAWWSQVKGELPADATRELLAVLDAVSRRIERSLATEAECRTLLERRTAFRGTPVRGGGAARLAATSAYDTGRSGGAR